MQIRLVAFRKIVVCLLSIAIESVHSMSQCIANAALTQTAPRLFATDISFAGSCPAAASRVVLQLYWNGTGEVSTVTLYSPWGTLGTASNSLRSYFSAELPASFCGTQMICPNAGEYFYVVATAWLANATSSESPAVSEEIQLSGPGNPSYDVADYSSYLHGLVMTCGVSRSTLFLN